MGKEIKLKSFHERCEFIDGVGWDWDSAKTTIMKKVNNKIPGKVISMNLRRFSGSDLASGATLYLDVFYTGETAVDAGRNLKNEIKKDVIDIIQALKEEPLSK